MFIAMNRFRVAKGSEAAFEQVWLSRDSHLDKVPGFVEFHLLKGPEAEDSHALCVTHGLGTQEKHLLQAAFSHVAVLVTVFDFGDDPAADFVRIRMEPPFG
jgi:Antibiotic biosynthesis monooxygenase